MERRLLFVGFVFLVVAGASSGCSSPWAWSGDFWSDESDTAQGPSEETLSELRKKAKRVGDLVYPWQLSFIKSEGIALVTGLQHTGSSPPAGGLRDRLKKEIQTHKVSNIDRLMDSDETSMVMAKINIPPAAKKGDRLDIQVVIPPGSETTSLKGGWLMSTRFRRIENYEGEQHQGDVDATGEGIVLVDGLFLPDARASKLLMGRVLGGAEVQRDRDIGLQVRRPDLKGAHAITVAKAINARFSAVDGSRKIGSAVAKDNRFIELHIPAIYQGNLARFLEVVSAVPLNENASERTARLQLLAKQLLEPSTSGTAALALEAAGRDSIALLEQGLGSPRPEVAFYSAEALAYMDEKQGVEVLRTAAKEQPQFRWHAITALAAMTHTEAYEALSDLLQHEDAETRYGAFRALRLRNDQDPYVRGEKVRDEFYFHVVTSLSKPMVHFSRRERAEAVVFGHDQRIDNLNQAIFPGGSSSGIMLKPMPGGRVLVSRFAAGKSDQRRETSGQLVDVMREVIAVGGGYQELYEMCVALRDAKAWSGELAVDALPTPKRSSGYNAADDSAAATPFPSLFDPEGDSSRRESISAVEYEGDEANEKSRSDAESKAAEDDEAGDEPSGLKEVSTDGDVEEEPDAFEEAKASAAAREKEPEDSGDSWFPWF